MQVNATPVISMAASAALGQCLRVKYDSTYGLVVASAMDKELGTLNARHIVSGLGASEYAAVVTPNAPGTIKMVAAGAITAFAVVYGADDGKIDDTANPNPIGITLEAATADGDLIEVLRLPALQSEAGDFPGGLHFEDDFIGDYPAAATAMDGGEWTKVETLGLGVIPSDEANGVLKFSFDAVEEAATAALYMANAPFDVDQGPVFQARVAIFDIGDDAALDINIGMAIDTHATDFDSIAQYIAFHFNGANLSACCQSYDGTTTVAATDSLVDLVDDTYANLKIDMRDLTDCKFYINGTRVLATTTFDFSAYSGTLTPIVHVEKASNNTTADVRVDKIQVDCERA